jgi:hypothetical protein
MKTELLHLMKNDDRSEAIKAVLLSRLLPEAQLQQFLDSLTERALRRVLGLPGCSQWTGRASWDAWAVKVLHSKDRGSLCFLRATERAIARTTKEAQQAARDGAAYDAEPIGAAAEAIRAAAEAIRASMSSQTSKSRHALEASHSAIRTASCAAVALSGSPLRVTEAIEAEQEQQYQDLLSLINTMEV